MKFPYRQYLTAPSATVPGGILFRPIIPLKLIGSTGVASMSAFVDTGADETLLPRSVALLVGAKIDDSRRWQTEGLGGQKLPVALGAVDLELSDGRETFRWPAKVGLVDFSDPVDEVTILGQAGFFEYFRVICDGHLWELTIEVTASFKGSVR